MYHKYAAQENEKKFFNYTATESGMFTYGVRLLNVSHSLHEWDEKSSGRSYEHSNNSSEAILPFAEMSFHTAASSLITNRYALNKY